MRRLVCLVAILLFAALPVRAENSAKPGNFDYLVLALSWSPNWCSSRAGREDTEQCGTDRRYGFIVHGLWPQNERGYPTSCVREPHPVPPEVTERMLPLMPSRKLISHQWKKHGSCFSASAAEYFDRTRAAFERVRIPEALKAPSRSLRLPVSEVEAMFGRDNPGLTSDAVAVTCRGHHVAEVRVCMTPDLAFRPCGKDVRDRCKGEALFQAVR